MEVGRIAGDQVGAIRRRRDVASCRQDGMTHRHIPFAALGEPHMEVRAALGYAGKLQG